jgi:hypothetical protein
MGRLVYGEKYEEASKILEKRYSQEELDKLTHYDIKQLLESINAELQK